MPDGNIKVTGGKAVITWGGKEHPFGIFFITCQVKKILSRSRPGFYTRRIRELIKDLENYGIAAIPAVKKSMLALVAGSDINRDFLKMVCGWLDNLAMVSRMKSGREPSARKKFCDNYDNIFRGAA